MALIILGNVVIGVLLQVAELPRGLYPRRHFASSGTLELLELGPQSDDALRRDRLSRSGIAHRVGRYPPSGDGGMRVSPVTSGISIAKSSTKHHDHSSPGWSERING